MTNRLVLGIDPGQTGAIATIADGLFFDFIDMPCLTRKAGGHEVDGITLADRVREVRARAPGAYVVAALEAVSAMPKQGVTSVFRFGESFGIAKGVLGALKIPMVMVAPATWKRSLGMLGSEKDLARTLAIRMYPPAAPQLQRKKDVGRADALLIAHWAQTSEIIGQARP